MIKSHINKAKDKIWVHTSGTAQDMMVETTVLIQQIFQGIHAQNPEAAQGYKNNLLGTLLAPGSPVWKEK
jgi:hypothetical protein